MAFYREFAEYYAQYPYDNSAPKEAPLVDFNMDVMPHEAKRMISIINEVAKNSPLGKSILEQACAAGYKLKFQSMYNAKGAASESGKTITLSTCFPPKSLFSTLVHESRHACQFEKGYHCNFENYDLKSSIMLSRAMEADAQAVAAGACLEYAATTGSKEPLMAMNANAAPVIAKVVPFVQKGQKEANGAVLRAAFEGWYDNTSIVRAYEEQYQLNPLKRELSSGIKGMHNKSVSSATITNDLCIDANGDKYWAKKPDILEAENKIAISRDTVETADTYFTARMQKMGVLPDKSYKDLPVKEAPATEKKANSSGFRVTMSAGAFFDLKKNRGR
ncbi:MAG: hypothetical protein IJ752_03275 [Alphaproteobacteria bacterium]|nr:hypothetical protein [Alphaproteobacteria bacterium]